MLSDSIWIKMIYPENYNGEFESQDRSILFRKEFSLSAAAEEATLYVCALGLGESFINGKRVTDNLLTTPYTCYDKRVIYQTYDITHLVKDGKNAIGVHVGNGMYNDNLPNWKDDKSPWRHTPKLIAKIKIKYSDGTQEAVISDDSWKVNFGPCLYNHSRQGEFYDASLTCAGYDTFGFDDRGWSQAVKTFGPGGELSGEEVVPIRVIQTLSPIGFDNGIYDFGVNISGRIKVKLSGKKGQKVTFTYYERPLDENTENSNNMYLLRHKMPIVNRNIVICSGGTDEYAPAFCYHGFRYVMVENAPEDMEIKAEFICSDLERVGDFETSDVMLAKIHEASVRATLSNFVGIPTDCPHREQNGWTGDALCSLDQSLMNFDMKIAYRKWLGDFRDVQRKTGQLPGIVPSAGYGYNWGSGPAWDSAVILIPYKMFLHTKDREIIDVMWDTMEKYMGFISYMSKECLVDFGLGDWCPVRSDHMCPTVVTDTAFFYADCEAMSKMAKITGRDCKHWDELCSKIKSAWQKSFDNNKEYESYQTFYACGIYFNLFDKNELGKKAQCLNELVKNNGYHIDCGILGTKFIFNALSDYGYEDTIYKMITNPTYPSYAYWINNQMTTLCERWDMSFSQNHHMFSEVDNWFYRYVGGIKFTDNGLEISPSYLEKVEKVKVKHRGIIVEREGKRVKVKLPVSARVKVGNHDATVSPGEYEFSF